MKRACLFLLALTCAFLDGAAAERTLPVVKIPHAATPPALDGDADGPSWSQAAVIHGFLPASDSKGEADRIARLPTTLRLLWDRDYLYLAFDCRGGHPEADPTIKPGGLLYMHSACEVFLDPIGDGREFMEFQFSPLGQSVAVVHVLTAAPEYTSEGRLVQDFSEREHWHFVQALPALRAVGGHASHGDSASGWSLTVAIPADPAMKRRGTTHFEPGEIRANFARHEFGPDPATGERSLLPMYWSPVKWGCPHISADLMGRLILEP